jgi:hypothetical protein
MHWVHLKGQTAGNASALRPVNRAEGRLSARERERTRPASRTCAARR